MENLNEKITWANKHRNHTNRFDYLKDPSGPFHPRTGKSMSPNIGEQCFTCKAVFYYN